VPLPAETKTDHVGHVQGPHYGFGSHMIFSHRTRDPVDGGANSAPYHIEVFPNDVSGLSATTDGFQLVIHSDPDYIGTVLVADPSP
jgi:hypothetical protein